MSLKVPLISIIIPTFNRAHLIGETLDSILEQTYQNWECIIVDDGSTDNTIALMASYLDKDSRFKYHHRPKDRRPGGNAARNYGLENSQGEYIQWFDSDDLMYPKLLELQLDNLQKDGKEFSVCLYDRYNEDFTKIMKLAKPHKINIDFYYDYIIQSFSTNLPTILFSKKIIGNYRLSEDLHKSQEYEFLPRIFREYANEGTLLNKVLVKVRRHQDSITENLTPQKCDSALQAIFTVRKEMPQSARMIENKIAQQYLKTLYLSFSHEMTGVFYKHLIKLPTFGFLKSLISIPLLAIIYPLCRYLKFPKWHFKRIYKLYQ